MTCLSGARLAAAASDEDAAALDHAEICASCAAALALERKTRALLAASPEVRLGGGRRAAMRAELLAASDALPAASRGRHRGLQVGAALAALAAAAAIVIVVWARGSRVRRGDPDPAVAPEARSIAAIAGLRVDAGAVASPVPTAVVAARPSPAPSPPAPVATADILSSDARFERAGDLVQVSEGAMTLDARGRRPTEIVTQGARVMVNEAQVKVTVRGRRLVQVQVFAGAVEIHTAGRTQIVELGEIWKPPARTPSPPRASHAPAPLPSRAPVAPSPAAPRVSVAPSPVAPRESPLPMSSSQPSRPSSSREAAAPQPAASPALQAFRVGWEALRAARYSDAIAAFDRATDPAVIEDATYWAAVAAARSGDQLEAHRRLRRFVVAFPASLHAAEARAALGR